MKTKIQSFTSFLCIMEGGALLTIAEGALQVTFCLMLIGLGSALGLDVIYGKGGEK